VLSKCVAGCDRDWEFAAEALRAGLVQPDVLTSRVPDLPVDCEPREHVDRMLRVLCGPT
jgi:hypothetical protein